MKWAVFAVGLVAAAVLGFLVRQNRRVPLAVWMTLGALPFLDTLLPHVNIYSREYYRGDSRGFEVTLVDLLVFALLIATSRARQPAPYRVARYAYLLVAGLSVFWAVSPLFAAFGVWKLIRLFVLLAVVNRGCDDPRTPIGLLKGMTAGSLLQLGVTLYQRYAHHAYQAPGLFPHQNALGMAMNLVLPVSLELVLAGIGGWLSLAAVVAGPVTIVLTLSRGAMATLAATCSTLYVLSAARTMSLRKLVLAGVAAAFLGGVWIKAGDTIIQRFESAPETSAGDREHFNAAAALMLEAHPLGIGINNYSLAVTVGDYWERTAGEAGENGWRAEDTPIPGVHFGGVAHHIYWLTAAEMGYAGLASLLVLLAAPLVTAFRYGVGARADPRGDLLLGLGVGLLAFDVMGLLEWGFRETCLGYLYWMVMGVVAAIARQIRSAREAQRDAIDEAVAGPARLAG